MKTLLVVLAALVVFPANAALLRIQAESWPASDLPGVKPYFRLEIENTGDESVVVGNYAKLDVRNGDVEYSARFGPDGGDIGPFMLDPVILARGESVEGVFGFAPNEWMYDRRLNVPSENVLTFQVAYFVLDHEDSEYISTLPEKERGATLAILRSEYRDRMTWVVSTPAHYRVEQPTGVDAEAWNYLEASTGNEFTAGRWSSELAHGLLQSYPWSGFTPEALLVVRTNVDGLEAYLEEATSRYPDSGASPSLAMRLAAIREQKIKPDVDLQQSIEYSRAARAAVDRVLADKQMPPFLEEKLEVFRTSILSEERLRKIKQDRPHQD